MQDPHPTPASTWYQRLWRYCRRWTEALTPVTPNREREKPKRAWGRARDHVRTRTAPTPTPSVISRLYWSNKQRIQENIKCYYIISLFKETLAFIEKIESPYHYWWLILLRNSLGFIEKRLVGFSNLNHYQKEQFQDRVMTDPSNLLDLMKLHFH